MRIFIILLLFMGFMNSYAEAKPKEIVAEYIGGVFDRGIEAEYFVSKNNTLYILYFCEGIWEVCKKWSSYTPPFTGEEPFLRFSIVVGGDAERYIGRQMIITPQKTETEYEGKIKKVTVLASQVRLDKSTKAPKNTKVSPEQTIIGKVRYRQNHGKKYPIVVTKEGKRYELRALRHIFYWLDYPGRAILSGYASTKINFVFKGRFYTWNEPKIFYFTEAEEANDSN